MQIVLDYKDAIIIVLAHQYTSLRTRMPSNQKIPCLPA